VKTRLHEADGFNPAVLREQGVEGPMESVVGPALRSGEAYGLPEGVYPRIGAPGSMSHRATAENALEDSLELALNRPACGLPLPSDEAGAVIV
jgi:hypothetical protein